MKFGADLNCRAVLCGVVLCSVVLMYLSWVM